MIRAFWFAIKVGMFIALTVWVANRPGHVSATWLDYTVDLPMGLFLLALVLLILLSIFVYQVIKTFVDFPKSFARYREIQRREKGYLALTLGLTAVAAGDVKAARLQARKTAKFMPEDTGLPLLLQAQAARLDGRTEEAHAAFLRLLTDKNAGFLGVRGLLQTALDKGDTESALSLAQKALALHPKQGWILKTLYDLHIRLRHWPEALEILKRLEKISVLPADKIPSDRSAILLAQAEEDTREGRINEALAKTKRAVRTNPSFVPATLALAGLYQKKGKIRDARAAIEALWKTTPHPALLPLWAELTEVKSEKDTMAVLRAFERLLKINKNSPEGHMALGKAALKARLWGVARDHFGKAEELFEAQDTQSAALYTLWAALEEQSTHDEEMVKMWLHRAAEAPPEKGWVCSETGRKFESWHALTPSQGTFNTIVWGAALGMAVVEDNKMVPVFSDTLPQSLRRYRVIPVP